jgi:hypothetical protein
VIGMSVPCDADVLPWPRHRVCRCLGLEGGHGISSYRVECLPDLTWLLSHHGGDGGITLSEHAIWSSKQ